MNNKTRFLRIFIIVIMSFSCVLFWACNSCNGKKEITEKVALIGFDAADWRFINPLINQGELPNFKKLMDSGSYGTMSTIKPVLSPIIWTSIATGKTPPQHGILDFMSFSPEPAPTTSDKRQTKALWNILTDKEIPSGTIGWLVTHPAEKVSGYMVSDRTSILSFYSSGAHSSSGAGKTYPPELYEDIKNLITDPDSVSDETIINTFGIRNGIDPDKMRKLKGIYAQTESYTAIAEKMLREQPVNLFNIYYEGIDTACHLFIRYMPPALPGVSGEDIERYSEMIPNVYRYFDVILGRLLNAIPQGTNIYLMSDHGFRYGQERPLFSSAQMETPYAEEWHSEQALLMASGPAVKTGLIIRDASVYDITPTVLHHLSIPSGNDMKGNIMLELLLNEEPALKRIATHDSSNWKEKYALSAPSDENDTEAIQDKLKSLGYLSGSSDNKPYRNLGAYYQAEKDYEKAVEMYSSALAANPDDTLSFCLIGQAYLQKGEPGKALEYLEKATELSPDLIEAIIIKADAYYKNGRISKALEILKEGAAKFPGDPRFSNARGSFLAKEGNYTEAAEDFKTSLSIYEFQEQAQLNLLHCYFRSGKPEEGFASLEKAIPLFSNSIVFLSSASDIFYYSGQFDRSLEMLEKALAIAPDNEGTLLRKSSTLYEMNLTDNSMKVLNRVLELNPDSFEAYFRLGNNLLKNNNLPEAEKMFEKSLAINSEFLPAKAQMAVTLAGQKKYEKAMVFVNEVLKKDPFNSIAITLRDEVDRQTE